MKSFRIVVALRLAIFPLIFNLSFAGELEVIPEDFVISTLNEVNEEKSTEQIENNTSMDSSPSVQNDDMQPINYSDNVSELQNITKNVISTLDEVNEEKSTTQIESNMQMDFSAMPRNDDKYIQDSQLFTQLDEVGKTSLRSE